MEIGRKIIVLGCPGSGKSTFARKLRDKTGLPLIHLDNIWWMADRTHLTPDAFDRVLEKTLSGDQWIIDGNYRRTLEVRFRACDTAIFLDYDEETCLAGISERIGKKRPDIPWVENSLDPELVNFVRRYRSDDRPLVYALLEKYSERQIHILHTRAEAENWLFV